MTDAERWELAKQAAPGVERVNTVATYIFRFLQLAQECGDLPTTASLDAGLTIDLAQSGADQATINVGNRCIIVTTDGGGSTKLRQHWGPGTHAHGSTATLKLPGSMWPSEVPRALRLATWFTRTPD